MRARIYAAIVAKPIKFPEDLEIRIFPLRRDDDTSLGVSYSMEEHHSWDWVRNQYQVNSEAEPRVKAGESIAVSTGFVTMNFPRGTEFPPGSDVMLAAQDTEH
jgi:hypothetical protein